MNLTDDEIRVKCVLGLGWTMHRNGNTKCGSDIPKYEAILWENHFVPPHYYGNAAHWHNVPQFTHSVDAALTLCDRLREEGWHCILVQSDGVWGCSLTNEVTGACELEKDPALARAICLAFLKVGRG